MNTWWKRLIAALPGDRLDQLNPDPTGLEPHHHDAQESPPMSHSETTLRPDPAVEELRERVAWLAEATTDLADKVERHSGDAAGRAEQVLTGLARLSDVLNQHASGAAVRSEEIKGGVAAATEEAQRRSNEDLARSERAIETLARLSASAERNSAVIQGLGGQFAQALENTQAASEHTQRVREIVAGLPDIAAAQAETVGNLDQRFQVVEQRTAALADTVDGGTRSLGEVKEAVADLRRFVTGLQQALTDLATHQRQIAESLNGLFERTSQITEIFKAHAQKLKQLAESPETQLHALREHITSETNRLAEVGEQARGNASAEASRSKFVLVCSVIAALAAIAAAFGVFLK